MGAISIRQTLMLPVVLCAAMLAVGFAVARLAGVEASGLFLDYTVTGSVVTFFCLSIWLFIEVAKLAYVKADKPLEIIWHYLPGRLALGVLPALVFPLFLGGFTTAKATIPFVVGYHWEGFWADVDQLIFGVDAWRITHAILGKTATYGLSFFYTIGWGGILLGTNGFMASHGKARFVATYYTAMMLTWLLGGWLMAYSFSAAGPVFAHLVDPALGARFVPLRKSLDLLLAPESPVRLTQDYLAGAINKHIAIAGSGISAMPSMHVGAATIYVFAALRTRWLWPAISFWLLIFVGSVHFGYHYAVDGLAAAGIAALCWKVSAAYFTRLQNKHLVPVVGERLIAAERSLAGSSH